MLHLDLKVSSENNDPDLDFGFAHIFICALPLELKVSLCFFSFNILFITNGQTSSEFIILSICCTEEKTQGKISFHQGSLILMSRDLRGETKKTTVAEVVSNLTGV